MITVLCQNVVMLFRNFVPMKINRIFSHVYVVMLIKLQWQEYVNKCYTIDWWYLIAVGERGWEDRLWFDWFLDARFNKGLIESCGNEISRFCKGEVVENDDDANDDDDDKDKDTNEDGDNDRQGSQFERIEILR